MLADKNLRSPTKRCHNCGLECNGMFCCEWCINTYLEREEAHRVARRAGAASRPNKGSTPDAGQEEASG